MSQIKRRTRTVKKKPSTQRNYAKDIQTENLKPYPGGKPKRVLRV